MKQELTDEEWHTLIVYARWWANNKKDKFFHWTIGDVINEVIVAFFSIKHRYNPSRGSMNTFLNAHIWDPVFRSYCKQHGISISRPGQKRGQRMPARVYTNKWYPLPDDYDKAIAPPPEEDVEVPLLPDEYEDIIELLKRGLNQKQISFVLGVTESRISQKMRQLRKQMNIST